VRAVVTPRGGWKAVFDVGWPTADLSGSTHATCANRRGRRRGLLGQVCRLTRSTGMTLAAAQTTCDQSDEAPRADRGGTAGGGGNGGHPQTPGRVPGSRPAATTTTAGRGSSAVGICQPARLGGVTSWRSKKRPRLCPSGRNEGGRDEGRGLAGCSARARRLWPARCGRGRPSDANASRCRLTVRWAIATGRSSPPHLTQCATGTERSPPPPPSSLS